MDFEDARIWNEGSDSQREAVRDRARTHAQLTARLQACNNGEQLLPVPASNGGSDMPVVSLTAQQMTSTMPSDEETSQFVDDDAGDQLMNELQAYQLPTQDTSAAASLVKTREVEAAQVVSEDQPPRKTRHCRKRQRLSLDRSPIITVTSDSEEDVPSKRMSPAVLYNLRSRAIRHPARTLPTDDRSKPLTSPAILKELHKDHDVRPRRLKVAHLQQTAAANYRKLACMRQKQHASAGEELDHKLSMLQLLIATQEAEIEAENLSSKLPPFTRSQKLQAWQWFEDQDLVDEYIAVENEERDKLGLPPVKCVYHVFSGRK